MLIIFISENHKILKMHLYIRSRRCRLNCNHKDKVKKECKGEEEKEEALISLEKFFTRGTKKSIRARLAKRPMRP